MFNFTSTNAYYTINLKFSHNPKHPQGNHYDAITQIPPVKKIPILSKVSDFYGWEDIKKEKSSTMASSTTVIDLTDEDDGLTFPNQVPLLRTNSTANSLYEGTTASVMKHTFPVKPNVLGQVNTAQERLLDLP